ncbi:MAG: tyrosine-type recombinase/integrase, partial [Campylobacter sp.]|uniref:tyrosine-type recombinase/integrase n=1 Tax=Campylobacter sp. TaxID=205 RepID=UPI001B43C4AF
SITIGKYPSISLAEARQKANEFKALLAKGIDPRSYTNEHELTFQDIANKWLQDKAKQELTNYKDTQGRLNNHILPKIGDIKIKDLKRDKLINCILEVELKSTRGDGYETKTRIFMILRDILKYITIQGIIQDYTSPLADLNFSDICKDKHIVTNHRFIKDPTKLKEFLTAIDNYKGNIYTKFALQLGTYTALRSGTIRALKWEYIDFTQDIINIPAELMKMKKPFILPISSQAKAILKELKAYQLGEYLFSINSKIMSENTLNKAIKILGFGDEVLSHLNKFSGGEK